jgi:hypothetical protein
VSSEIQRLVWTFDVDGCLVDSLTGTSLRPGATVNLPPQTSSSMTGQMRRPSRPGW